MDERWIRTHVRACVTRHLGNGNGIQTIVPVIDALSEQEGDITPEAFVQAIGTSIMESTEPSICLARNCVQESILFCIVENGRDEPLIPDAYKPLASSAIAKHLFLIYGNL
jgi:hypothetical protein